MHMLPTRNRLKPIDLAVDAPRHERSTADVARLVTLGAGLGWAWLIANVWIMASTADLAALGPGMGLFSRFSGLPAELRASLVVLCTVPPGQALSLSGMTYTFAMWLAMVLAMMLPSAAPVLSNAESTASRARMTTIFLALGYLSTWTAFALVATLLQELLAEARILKAGMAPMTDTLAATTLLAAGLYQFTPWKAACLSRCRQPAPIYFAGAPSPGGIYRRGLQLGLDCFGCCWALMLVMFAVGVMNVIWIAGLGAVMSLEKLLHGRWLSRLIGVGLIVGACALLAASPAGIRLIGTL